MSALVFFERQYFQRTARKINAALGKTNGNVIPLSGIVLSESEAHALAPHGDILGTEVQVEGHTFTVVGVAADALATSLKSAPPKMAYVHYQYRPPYHAIFLTRSEQRPDLLFAAIRNAIWKQEPMANIASVKSLDSQMTDSLSTERFQAAMLIGFGASALLLAMLGIYGVSSYSLASRNQEIGLRIAIGATRAKIYALALDESGVAVITGLAAGLLVSMASGRLVQNLLYGVSAFDFSAALVVALLFLSAACLAALLPARRAASIDPIEALRSE